MIENIRMSDATYNGQTLRQEWLFRVPAPAAQTNHGPRLYRAEIAYEERSPGQSHARLWAIAPERGAAVLIASRNPQRDYGIHPPPGRAPTADILSPIMEDFAAIAEKIG